MKFSLPFILVAITGVAAQATPSSTAATPGASSGCDADYIVTRCLETEKPKVGACTTTDYECLCAAYEAVATCYNNCPSDPRASAARSEVQAQCQRVTTSSTRTTSSSSTSTDSTDSLQTATSTSGVSPSNTADFEQPEPTESEGAGEVLGTPAGLFLGAAGVIAALL